MNYVRNCWYVAFWSHEVVQGTPASVTILGEPIAVYRGESGRLTALEDRCVHRLAPLSLGRCEGDRLRCMYHGLLYAPDGQVVDIPGQDIIPPHAKVRSYPIEERHGWIWIWMGDPQKADAELIPAAVGLDDPDFIMGSGALDYDAEAELINDNLLDFSHLSYVHADSFQSGPEFAERTPRITPLPRGIRYERWLENTLGSSTRRTPVPMDNFMTYDFVVPGILLMRSGTFPVGTAAQCEHQAPDFSRAERIHTFTSQAVTPISERKARYFFCWGPHRVYGDEAQRDMLLGLAAMAFDEDKRMIEAQQRIIDITPTPRIMPTAHDRSVTIFNRLVKSMIEQERHETLAEAR